MRKPGLNVARRLVRCEAGTSEGSDHPEPPGTVKRGCRTILTSFWLSKATPTRSLVNWASGRRNAARIAVWPWMLTSVCQKPSPGRAGWPWGGIGSAGARELDGADLVGWLDPGRDGETLGILPAGLAATLAGPDLYWVSLTTQPSPWNRPHLVRRAAAVPVPGAVRAPPIDQVGP